MIYDIINFIVKLWVWTSVAFLAWVAWGAFRMWRQEVGR